jgi:hypothetical protein
VSITISKNYTFGAVAFELKEWERMSLNASASMCPIRADQVSHDIMEISKSFRRAIDAKSSESLRNKNNSQSVLIDKVGRNRVEKVYTMKDQMSKSLFNSFLGRDLRLIFLLFTSFLFRRSSNVMSTGFFLSHFHSFFPYRSF